MPDDRLSRVVEMYRRKGIISDDVDGDLRATAVDWLAQARDELDALEPLLGASQWRVAYNTAYDIYRHAAEAVVLASGYRVRAAPGAHEATFAVAHAIIGEAGEVFSGQTAGTMRTTRNGLEYIDPDRPTEVDEESSRWAAQLAERAVADVSAFLS